MFCLPTDLKYKIIKNMNDYDIPHIQDEQFLIAKYFNDWKTFTNTSCDSSIVMKLLSPDKQATITLKKLNYLCHDLALKLNKLDNVYIDEKYKGRGEYAIFAYKLVKGLLACCEFHCVFDPRGNDILDLNSFRKVYFPQALYINLYGRIYIYFPRDIIDEGLNPSEIKLKDVDRKKTVNLKLYECDIGDLYKNYTSNCKEFNTRYDHSSDDLRYTCRSPIKQLFGKWYCTSNYIRSGFFYIPYFEGMHKCFIYVDIYSIDTSRKEYKGFGKLKCIYDYVSS